MICPNCNSENVQFSSKTSGGGYSAGNGCCGYMILGPLGLLCGACGSGATTEEFWVCNSCGHKFSNGEAKSKMKEVNKIAENCHQYKIELGNKPFSYYEKKYETAKQNYETALQAYTEQFDRLSEMAAQENKMVRKYKKKYCKGYSVADIILVILTIASAFTGMWPLIVAMLILRFIWSAVRKRNKEKLCQRVESILAETNPAFQTNIDRKNETCAEKVKWEAYLEKAEYLKRNDKSKTS